MLRRCLVLLVGLVVLGLPARASADERCPNEAQRPAGSYSSRLPDCRAFEQASPVDKGGATMSGYEGVVHASPSGDRIVFEVPSNMPGAEGGYSPQLFLASRKEEAWSSRGLPMPFQPHGFSSVVGWSDDLSEVLDQTVDYTPGSGDGLYMRDGATGALHVLVSPFGNGEEQAHPAGFSADGSRLIFESSEPLLPSAPAGHVNLYELHAGVLSLAGVLPDGSSPPGGSFAGPYDWGNGHTEQGGATREYFTQNTISSDGSRVFFTAGGTDQIYVRENGERTVQVSASQRSVPDPNGVKPAVFLGATSDGSFVFFMSCEKLTNDSTAVSTAEPSCSERGEGEDLYEYSVDSGALSDLTVDRNPADTVGAAVQGVLGMDSGPNGEYVYFAAEGALAPGASPDTGPCEPCNLYVWHDGETRFIANLPGNRAKFNWWPEHVPVETFEGLHAEVAASGGSLLFSSEGRLTGYDNAGMNELYRYDAGSGRLACVSCDPSGLVPVGDARLQSINVGFNHATEPEALLRNLSSDGSRAFFESPDALVPQDTNGVQDVYEWEQAGAGSCRESSESFSASSDGCLYLISTGRSPDKSFFADAAASGNDVFFFTDQPLVGQDQDGLVDVYDARVGGGIAAQSPVVSSPCGGEACRGPVGSPPLFGVPSSAALTGAGNLTSAVSVPPVKTKAKKPKPKKKRHVRKRRKAKKATVSHGSAKRAHKTTRRGK